MPFVIEELARNVGLVLQKNNLKIATAESCTGGGLSYYLTNLPGSSAWFERGFVVYCNEAKIEMLNVNPVSIELSGAVSETVAQEMAAGALQNSHADLSIAITGIAGPDGGSTLKPVGTVWIAWAFRNQDITTHVDVYAGDREAIRTQSIETALSKLLALINK